MNTLNEKKIDELKLHKSDSGSTSIQIFNLTIRIKKITNHLKTFKKDFHSKRGLIKIVNNRKKLLKYLKNKDYKKYVNTIKLLNIKK